jgi:hypothetical protein
MKQNLKRSNAKFVKICLRKQAHYRAREGEWVQLSAGPYKYVCRMLFQAQIKRAQNPVTLSYIRVPNLKSSALGLVLRRNNESAGKKKTTRIIRAGTNIKPLLVQCALAAIKATKKHPELFNATII